MQENDTSGVFYARPAVWDEPRGRTRVLLLATGALASVLVNVLQFAYIIVIGARGGAPWRP